MGPKGQGPFKELSEHGILYHYRQARDWARV